MNIASISNAYTNYIGHTEQAPEIVRQAPTPPPAPAERIVPLVQDVVTLSQQNLRAAISLQSYGGVDHNSTREADNG
jgi:hypothetical protein